jgi:hypothetical protein
MGMEVIVGRNAMRKFFQKVKTILGLFNLTEFEARLLVELKQRLPDAWRDILDSQLVEFNQTDRLIGESRGEVPPFGHTSFYKNVWGKSSRNFAKRFPTEKDSDVMATLDVVDGDGNTISVEFVLVGGILFSIKYRSPTKRYVPNGDFAIENFKLLI